MILEPLLWITQRGRYLFRVACISRVGSGMSYVSPGRCIRTVWKLTGLIVAWESPKPLIIWIFFLRIFFSRIKDAPCISFVCWRRAFSRHENQAWSHRLDHASNPFTSFDRASTSSALEKIRVFDAILNVVAHIFYRVDTFAPFSLS